MSSLLAIFNVPPFLSDGLTMPVLPALKPEAPLEPLEPLVPDEPPPPQADSTSANAADPATIALVFNFTCFPPQGGAARRRRVPEPNIGGSRGVAGSNDGPASGQARGPSLEGPARMCPGCRLCVS